MLNRDYRLIIDANLLKPYNKWPLVLYQQPYIFGIEDKKTSNIILTLNNMVPGVEVGVRVLNPDKQKKTPTIQVLEAKNNTYEVNVDFSAIKDIIGKYKFEIYLEVDEKQSTIYQGQYIVKDWIDNKEVNNNEKTWCF